MRLRCVVIEPDRGGAVYQMQQAEILAAGNSACGRTIRSLQTWIKEGRYVPGHVLPSEDALGDQLHVSRSTVRTALKYLREKGLVQSQQGRRHVLASTRPTSPMSIMMRQTVVVIGNYERPLAVPAPGKVDPGVYEALRSLGHNTLSVNVDRLSDTMNALFTDPPLGVLVMEYAAHTHAEQEITVKVLVGDTIMIVNSNEPAWAKYDRVISDHNAGCYELTRWLIARGHRRILRLWADSEPASYWLKDRNAGYERAMTEAGLEILPPVSTANASSPTAAPSPHLLAGHLVEWFARSQPVDAILLASDYNAGPTVEACRLCGKEPHRDVAIAGYDNAWGLIPDATLGAMGPVATVDRESQMVGRAMVELLTERMAGKLPPEPQCRRVRPRLVVLDPARLVR